MKFFSIVFKVFLSLLGRGKKKQAGSSYPMR
ncbi:hypothetical protein XTPLMG728_3598 [Xanthomonas translucens pv. poae]|uniref:Uncharacterized protein n=1 Tax=Xanthomonas graminis pv. poae TaxID=227946 RepID=A0A0K3A9L0_9XANT|nr:hypothetical protein XTPLMG728_3598 [Xanthomonas translucens pv. poae]